mmetsp:Transcript_43816/g.126577  ORF Transcript_43816/g.126577 Transcript_43816/m.126577 type:complete len:215 (-) Transcript_43816:341-985(-)
MPGVAPQDCFATRPDAVQRGPSMSTRAAAPRTRQSRGPRLRCRALPPPLQQAAADRSRTRRGAAPQRRRNHRRRRPLASRPPLGGFPVPHSRRPRRSRRRASATRHGAPRARRGSTGWAASPGRRSPELCGPRARPPGARRAWTNSKLSAGSPLSRTPCRELARPTTTASPVQRRRRSRGRRLLAPSPPRARSARPRSSPLGLRPSGRHRPRGR